MILEPVFPDIQSILYQLEDKDIDLDPEFQRGDVWNTSKKQLLIDTIMRKWEIPPIFLINKDYGEPKEVLDGHQRLRAIEDFYNNRFRFNGRLSPKSENLIELDGLYFEQFPRMAKKDFHRFVLRIFVIREYEESEPFELFFRLNQNVSLTSAEKRNTFFGQARSSTKKLVDDMEAIYDLNINSIGFNNTRLAYHDVISRVLYCLDRNSISKKINDAELTEKYRGSEGFTQLSLERTEDSLSIISSSIKKLGKVKLNKPSLFSLLIFIAASFDGTESELTEILAAHEKIVKSRSSILSNHRLIDYLAKEYITRLSTGVNDSKSIIYRHFFIHYIAFEIVPDCLPYDIFRRTKKTINLIETYLYDQESSKNIHDILIDYGWGDL